MMELFIIDLNSSNMNNNFIQTFLEKSQSLKANYISIIYIEEEIFNRFETIDNQRILREKLSFYIVEGPIKLGFKISEFYHSNQINFIHIFSREISYFKRQLGIYEDKIKYFQFDSINELNLNEIYKIKHGKIEDEKNEKNEKEINFIHLPLMNKEDIQTLNDIFKKLIKSIVKGNSMPNNFTSLMNICKTSTNIVSKNKVNNDYMSMILLKCLFTDGIFESERLKELVLSGAFDSPDCALQLFKIKPTNKMNQFIEEIKSTQIPKKEVKKARQKRKNRASSQESKNLSPKLTDQKTFFIENSIRSASVKKKEIKTQISDESILWRITNNFCEYYIKNCLKCNWNKIEKRSAFQNLLINLLKLSKTKIVQEPDLQNQLVIVQKNEQYQDIIFYNIFVFLVINKFINLDGQYIHYNDQTFKTYPASLKLEKSFFSINVEQMKDKLYTYSNLSGMKEQKQIPAIKKPEKKEQKKTIFDELSDLILKKIKKKEVQFPKTLGQLITIIKKLEGEIPKDPKITSESIIETLITRWKGSKILNIIDAENINPVNLLKLQNNHIEFNF